jgi:hypothetical protein
MIRLCMCFPRVRPGSLSLYVEYKIFALSMALGDIILVGCATRTSFDYPPFVYFKFYKCLAICLVSTDSFTNTQLEDKPYISTKLAGLSLFYGQKTPLLMSWSGYACVFHEWDQAHWAFMLLVISCQNLWPWDIYLTWIQDIRSFHGPWGYYIGRVCN